ncbi:hypothetical protein COHA_008595 [Chlorella ohadii]|uniref:t-SNARE coiled-coil homology domain-containing protein n=1 Tax=Chlorella ohadii TaxID=2649997 RepID=A0AAD5DH44_9CHLO|nr:hypothetical protein COHA_008595 [Chlorella ohadii]
MARDPYYIVKDEVAETKQALQRELEDDCQSLEYMITEIDKSIDAAERNPQRFNLSQQELSDRRKWVMSTRRQIDSLRSGLSAGSAAAAAAADGSAAGRLAAAVHDENDRFIRSEGDRQQLLMQRQDEDLDQLSHHVVRIGELGKEMGQELHMQGQLLDELDTEIEGTSTRLQAAQVLLLIVLIFLLIA